MRIRKLDVVNNVEDREGTSVGIHGAMGKAWNLDLLDEEDLRLPRQILSPRSQAGLTLSVRTSHLQGTRLRENQQNHRSNDI